MDQSIRNLPETKNLIYFKTNACHFNGEWNHIYSYCLLIWITNLKRLVCSISKKTSITFLKDVLPRQARHLVKTFCRCLKNVLYRNLKHIFVRHFEETFVKYIVDVLQKTSKGVLLSYLEDTLKLSEDVSYMSYRRCLHLSYQKMSCRCLIRDVLTLLTLTLLYSP